jgi:pyrroline-5-carboxylate reductase
MGIAIISGVLASLQLRLTTHEANGVPPTPGTSTPPTSYMITAAVEDNALPDKFIGCVSRKESAKRLKTLFSVHESVEIVSGENVKAAREADVVILW